MAERIILSLFRLPNYMNTNFKYHVTKDSRFQIVMKHIINANSGIETLPWCLYAIRRWIGFRISIFRYLHLPTSLLFNMSSSTEKPHRHIIGFNLHTEAPSKLGGYHFEVKHIKVTDTSPLYFQHMRLFTLVLFSQQLNAFRPYRNWLRFLVFKFCIRFHTTFRHLRRTVSQFVHHHWTNRNLRTRHRPTAVISVRSSRAGYVQRSAITLPNSSYNSFRVFEVNHIYLAKNICRLSHTSPQ
jgi:hypothetical protein